MPTNNVCQPLAPGRSPWRDQLDLPAIPEPLAADSAGLNTLARRPVQGYVFCIQRAAAVLAAAQHFGTGVHGSGSWRVVMKRLFVATTTAVFTALFLNGVAEAAQESW